MLPNFFICYINDDTNAEFLIIIKLKATFVKFSNILKSKYKNSDNGNGHNGKESTINRALGGSTYPS